MDCEKELGDSAPGHNKGHFVLVHGALHGAWCWYKIVDLLEKDGHMVTAIDLTSAGRHPATADSVKSFEEYNQPLMDFLAHQEKSIEQGARIVLVGHSMGGVSLSYASEAFPHLIAVAVYVCALMFRGGESLDKEREYMLPDKEIIEKLEFNKPNGSILPTSFTMPKNLMKNYFYSETESVDATLSSLLIRPFPAMGIYNMDLKTTEERYGLVPRVYIKTSRDKLFPPARQEEIIARSPPEVIHVLESDHSPFFCMAEKLHQLFVQIAIEYVK
ncbi:hypothetical protein SUGI_1035630 [Cryptomeria japonica]|nr:hypothetical protein SUGI_1035630 [Cryptomeria japonica]